MQEMPVNNLGMLALMLAVAAAFFVVVLIASPPDDYSGPGHI
jgi:hypothetical protein